MILVVPTVLGGLWQLVELVLIDISLIRFFSITQVVSDGLFVILFSLFFIVFSFFNPFAIKRKIQNDKDRKLKMVRNSKSHFTMIFIVYSLIFILVLLIKILFTNDVPITFLGIAFALICGYEIYKIKEPDKILIKSNWVFELTARIAPLIVAFSFYLFYQELDAIRRDFYFGGKFKNFDYLNGHRKSNLLGDNSRHIKYFNDQYIFLELTQPDSTTKIEVLKFDAFFENQNTRLQTNQTEIDSLNNIIQLKDDEIDSLKSNLSGLKVLKVI